MITRAMLDAAIAWCTIMLFAIVLAVVAVVTGCGPHDAGPDAGPDAAPDAAPPACRTYLDRIADGGLWCDRGEGEIAEVWTRDGCDACYLVQCHAESAPSWIRVECATFDGGAP